VAVGHPAARAASHSELGGALAQVREVEGEAADVKHVLPVAVVVEELDEASVVVLVGVRQEEGNDGIA